jgi:undecaprenyl-diphosphatase
MNGFDTSIISGLNHLAHHSRTFDSSVVFLMSHDLFKGGVFMVLIWWAWFHKDGTHRRDYLLSGLAAAIVAVALTRVLVHALPFRERPLHTAGFDFTLPYTMRADLLEGWSSFPSDHAVLFFALATSLFFVWRPLGIFGFAYALIFISLPRLYLGIHWPTDIIAGAALGIALGWLGTLPSVRSLISRPAFALLDAQPGLFYGALFLIAYQTATLFNDTRETASFVRHTIARLI